MKAPLIVALFLLMFGTIALVNSIGNSRIQTLHGSDSVQLVAVGLCFGAGITLLLIRFLGG